MAFLPKSYMDSVVSIGYQTLNGLKWVGTGFIAAKAKDSLRVWLYLVTNRHIIEGQSAIWIRLHNEAQNTDDAIEVPLIENGTVMYSVHPNRYVDIAAIHLNGRYLINNNFSIGYIDIDNNAMSSEELRENGVSEGNLAYMLGYPMGLVNVNSKSPICRMGCIARMSKEQIAESNNILMDIQNFPGNSGSPVVLKPEVISIEGTKNLPRCVLIGIVHSYIPYRDVLYSRQTGEDVEIRTENSGIANMHPVELIREVINMEYESKNKTQEIEEDTN